MPDQENSKKTMGLLPFFSKFGLVLSRTKDTIVKDFLSDIPSYMQNVPSFEGKYTLEDVKNNYLNTQDAFSKFIDCIFNRLGYDLSHLEESKELVALFNAILNTALNLGMSIKQLGAEAEESLDLQNIINKCAEEAKNGKESLDVMSLGGQWGNDENGGGVSLELSGDLAKKLKAVFDLLNNLFKLIKSFRDIEWEKIINEAGDFGIYVKDTFADRFFDYILVTLLKNAREVYADDIEALVEFGDELKGEMADKVNDFKQQLLELKKEGEKQLTFEIQAKRRILKEEILQSGCFDSYMQLARVFRQIYAVLDFFQVIKSVRIDLVQYVPNIPNIGEVKLAKVAEANKQLESLFSKAEEFVNLPDVHSLTFVDDTANGAIKEINQEIDNIELSIRKALPVVDIYIIRWEKVEEMFTSPVNYIKTLYPINGYEDAEHLMTKIIEVARAFNGNIPDFKSIKRFLYDLLIRIEKEIVGKLREVASDAIDALKKVKEFVLDLLAILESVTVRVKGELSSAFNEFCQFVDKEATESKNALVELGDRIGTELSKMTEDHNLPYLTKGFSDSEMFRLFVQPFLTAVEETSHKYKAIESAKVEEMKTIFKEGGQSFEKFKDDYEAIFSDLKRYIDTCCSVKTYKVRFRSVVEQLKDEFKKQTVELPDISSAEEFNLYVKSLFNNVVKSGKLPSFSSFDFNAYFTIISDGVKSMVPSSPEIFYTRFLHKTEEFLESIVSGTNQIEGFVDKNIEGYENQVKEFVADVFAAYWTELVKELRRSFINPYLNRIERAVKQWAVNDILPNVMEKVIESIKEAGVSLDAVGELFDEVVEVSEDISQSMPVPSSAVAEAAKVNCKQIANNLLNLVHATLGLADQAKNINTWTDGLQFVLKFYRAIPSKIKRHIADMIDLPKWDFDNIQLPEYRLDMENKFLAVNLWDFADISHQEKRHVEGAVKIQLLAFVGEKKGAEDTQSQYGVYILPVVSGKMNYAQQIGKENVLTLLTSADVNKSGLDEHKNTDDGNSSPISETFADGKLGIFVTTQDYKPKMELLCSNPEITARLDLCFERGIIDKTGKVNAPEEPLKIFDAKYATLSVGNYPQSFYICYDKGFDLGVESAIKDLKLSLKLREANDFMEKILKDDIVLNLESLKLGYSLQRGFDIDGDFMVRIPFNTNIDLKCVRFSSLSLDMGGKGGNLLSMVNMNFTVDWDVVTISLPNLSLGLDCNVLTPEWKLGSLDFSPEFKFPSGLGISINLAGISGTGGLAWDSKTSTFTGVFELDIFELFSASAIFLFNMRNKDGSKGFSMFSALAVSFTPGIQLGFGFSLMRVGGTLGINRRMDSDKLREAVHDGTLSSILFIDNIGDHLDEVLSNISIYYPMQEGQFFAGLMAKITWAKFFNINLGLFIQAPSPVTIIMAGAFSMSVCESTEKLLCINIDFFGEIDFQKGILIDASIHDSYIVGLELHGDVVLRILWGGSVKGFLISAGGFHPEYTPASGYKVGTMKRMGMKLSYGIVSMSMESYFAVTSNSIQFGSETRLIVGWDGKFELSGRMYYNVLFQWKPFYFLADAGLCAAVRIFGKKLCAVDLSFVLSGPAQWHAKGKASFWFVFIKINVHFHLTWGKKQLDSNRSRIDIKPLLIDNFEDKNNSYWKATSSDFTDNMVSVSNLMGCGLVVHPSEKLSFCQETIPLNTELHKYGEEVINDFTKIGLAEVTIGNQQIQTKELDALFAPSLFKKMSEKEKLSADSFVNMQGGFTIHGSSIEQVNGSVQEVDTGSFENFTRDVTSVLETWKQWRKEEGDTVFVKKKLLLKNRGLNDSVTKKSSRVVALRKNFPQSRRVSVSENSSIKEYTNRASRRRSDEGFSRYTKQLDEVMMAHLDLSELSNKL